MKKIVLLLITLASSNYALAQLPAGFAEITNTPGLTGRLLTNGAFDPNSKSNSIQGNPYTTQNFNNGKVESINAIISFKYNAYRDAIEFKNGDTIVELPKEKAYSPITFGHQKMVIIEENGSNNWYTEVASNNEISALRKDKVNLIPGKEGNGYSDPTPSKFSSLKSEYFLKVGDNVVSFPKNKKSLTEVVKLTPEAEAYLSKNSNYLKDETKLITLTKLLTK